MPNVPGWFEYLTYFDNKLAQLQATEDDAGWTNDKLAAAFVEAGFPVDSDGMYAHFQQYGNTVAENVSPNGYFDVDYYMNSKLAQMQANNPGYSMDQLKAAFETANLSAWNHYTQYGFKEGINPSAQFNTDNYMDAKLAEMQATNKNYTMEQLDAAFETAGLNPIEHWFLYGKDENLDFHPGTEPIPYIDVPLVAGTDTYIGGPGNENFIGTVGGTNPTLTPSTKIDGTAGEDALTINMNSGFPGLRDGHVRNVDTINVNNETANQLLTLDTTGIDGIDPLP